MRDCVGFRLVAHLMLLWNLVTETRRVPAVRAGRRTGLPTTRSGPTRRSERGHAGAGIYNNVARFVTRRWLGRDRCPPPAKWMTVTP